MAFKQFKKQFLDVNDIKDFPNILRVINNLQSAIEDSLIPLISKTQNDSSILKNIQLAPGKTNVINHTLGRNLVGWDIIRKRGAADIWDIQDRNNSPNLTLLLRTNVAVTVDILVF